MPLTDSWPILKTGVWLYAGSVPVAVRVLHSAEHWGTGDWEDEEEMRNGKQEECYFVAYEKAGAPGKYSNLVPNLPTLDEAIAFVEAKFPGIKWQSQERLP